ncbi:MAG: hypothetical protein K5840_04015 [Eubacterium sp.]|nr:hypothetical protein [Eubacterium sp.]
MKEKRENNYLWVVFAVLATVIAGVYGSGAFYVQQVVGTTYQFEYSYLYNVAVPLVIGVFVALSVVFNRLNNKMMWLLVGILNLIIACVRLFVMAPGYSQPSFLLFGFFVVLGFKGLLKTK